MVYLHGLDVCAKHPVYRLIWVPFFRLFNAVIVNSHYTKQLAINAKVPSNRISILHPGVEIPDIGDANTRSFDFRARRNLGEVPVLLYVGRITPRKGLLCFVKNILPHILKEATDAVLVVIGDDPVDALQSSSNERTRVNAVINENGLKSKVHFLGICSDEELDNAYFAADILIFPVQQSTHDIEGFGMVAIEAAAHGLPTVAFSVGGVSDAVSDGSSGNLISPDDNLSFAQAVIRHIKKGAKSQPKDDCRKFAALFQWNEFGSRLRNIFRNVGQKGC
jgi:phosphatidylinositol alpha-1,6-mannosyltransferase